MNKALKEVGRESHGYQGIAWEQNMQSPDMSMSDLLVQGTARRPLWMECSEQVTAEEMSSEW